MWSFLIVEIYGLFDEFFELLTSSDMLVIDISESAKTYKVGDIVAFDLKYMGALGLLNSDYIEKRLV
jgi:predicted amino acid racemase